MFAVAPVIHITWLNVLDIGLHLSADFINWRKGPESKGPESMGLDTSAGLVWMRISRYIQYGF